MAIASPTASRRAFLVGAPVAATIPLLPASAFNQAADAVIERAWRRRVGAHVVFNNNTLTKAGENYWFAVIDEAEEVIRSTTAVSARGAAIQLWVSLSHSIMDRVDDDAINREDLGHFASRDVDLDWEARLVLSALRSLYAMGA